MKVSGNKNALLPMVCGTLLTDETVSLSNVPPISDCEKLKKYVSGFGAEIIHDKREKSASFCHKNNHWIDNTVAMPVGIRSTVLLMAPLLHRVGSFKLDHGSKGCALGVREIDPHLDVVSAFGCQVFYDGQECYVKAPDSFHAASLWMDYQSVTATETFLMMAVLAGGVSTLTNAACEPHVKYFCHFLQQMGAKIEGVGTSILTVEGVDRLSGVEFKVPDDHHEAATYAAIGAATGGVIEIETDVAPDMPLIVRQLRKVGLNVTLSGNKITTGKSHFIVENSLTPETYVKVEAAPWPYFPADLLPQIIGASIQSKGEVLFWNKVYEGALFWSSELMKFGVRTHLADPHRLLKTDGKILRPAVVEAPYIIRVVLGLVIAALQIEGRSEIKNADPITRAHPDFIEKLQSLGAKVTYMND
ncbi:UDP-N-acetylglucosamine 1-carboxyvinyltransferase [Veronia nyctiphanis]|uniref:UDP-N-acetylglucosamine 1-carboxyvinyltransferase n=1 Tax=Veronia nyctiphanis TaxID=1278244 RepID=A0A4Q0YZL7_9GAMM|nr:UDP-N-acetylglucosamine 1-carboxyvinyltransferase [Veronia nyctiphanis]